MAVFKGIINGMSSGFGVTNLPLIKRASVGVGRRTINSLILPENLDGRLEICRNDADVELYTGRLLFNRLLMAVRIDGQMARMGVFTLFAINYMLLPLAVFIGVIAITMGLFFAGLAQEPWANQLALIVTFLLPALGVLRILSNFRSWLALG